MVVLLTGPAEDARSTWSNTYQSTGIVTYLGGEGGGTKLKTSEQLQVPILALPLPELRVLCGGIFTPFVLC